MKAASHFRKSRKNAPLLLMAAVVGLATASGAHASATIGDFTITATNAQLTTTTPGATTFADSDTFAGYSGSVVTPVATISGGSINVGGSTNPDSGISSSIANYIVASSGSSVTIAFNADQSYFGMLWGSVDLTNTITFYEDGTSLGSFTGSELSANAGIALQPYPAAGSFVDFASSTPFDAIVLSETSLYFETDNYASAAAAVAPVPEPASWALLLTGFGLMGYSLRKRARTAMAFG